MTRLLVIGNSHTGALRKADDAFRAAFPSVETGYFAVPGAMFLTGKVNKRGHFVPGFRIPKDKETAVAINGAETIDLAGWDHILVVGHRYDFPAVAELLVDHDLLEGTRTGKGRLISTGFFDAVAKAQIAKTTDIVAGRLGTAHPFTMTIAPYPSEGITERADELRLGNIMRHFLAHDDAPALFDHWLDLVEAAITATGYNFLHQPDTTVAGPFATHSGYAIGAQSGTFETMNNVDHRHMNADFGLAMLTRFARQHLKMEPKAA